MKINQLPSRTWNWLHMNDTELAWDLNVAPCRIEVEEGVLDQQGSEDGFDWKTIETGAGREADVLFENKNAKHVYLNADKENGQTVRLKIRGESGNSSAGTVMLDAKEQAQITLIEIFAKTEDAPKGLALRTRIRAEKNSHIRLVQVFLQGEGQPLLNDVGCICGEQAKFDVLQLFIGKGDFYNGIRTDLKGNGAETTKDLGQKSQLLDLNLVVNHLGQKTNSLIKVDGILKDAAKKTFRGSIDFKTGSAGSKGTETEDVLLLGDDVENRTIPLILCAEEKVDGNHGATIGELDEETLFYFASRGLDKETAENIMTRSRLETLYRHIGDEETEKLAEQQLAEVLGDDMAGL